MENEDEQEQMKMGNKEALVLELNEQPPERGKSSSRSTITTQSSIVNDTEEPPKDAKTIEEEKRARRLEIVRKNRNPRDHMYTIRTKNSIVYHGTCLNRIPHGFGRKSFANGNYYEGDWKMGKRHGSGIHVNVHRCTRYEGEWRHGLRDGNGTSRRTMLGNWVEFAGWYTQNKKNGPGILRWSHGRTLKGVWRAGELVDIELDQFNRDECAGCIKREEMSIDFTKLQLDAQSVSMMLTDDDDDDTDESSSYYR